MSILYFEPQSGISGDMLLGAFCSLLDDYEIINTLPEKLNLPNAEISIKEVSKNGIVCNHIKILDKEGKHMHRTLTDILKIIDTSSLDANPKKIAKEIFVLLGKAESKVHNVPLDKIHFHELSGIDSIMDIVGCAVLIDRLDIEKSYSDPVCTGSGSVKTQHGIMPIPAPATAELLVGIPSYKGDEEGEKATPTGAAILKYMSPDFTIPAHRVSKIAYGPGEKDFKHPNVLRVSLIEPVKDLKSEDDGMYMVDSNIDDMPAEYLGNEFQEGLIEAGAVDFYFTPVQMKKGRPGFKISALTSREGLRKVSDYILENTSTIGIRYYPVSRDKLQRTELEVETKFGPVKVKKVIKPSGKTAFKIEYGSLKDMSKIHSIPIPQLESEINYIISKELKTIDHE